MRTRLTGLLVFALLAGAAVADDAGDRVRAAIEKLSDDDPDVRSAGRDLLGALAEERPDLVRPVTRNADPEVAGTAREVIFEHCILKEQVEQGRFDEILAAIADPGRDATARKELLRRFLDLGPKAAEFLAGELRESAAIPATESVTLAPGRLREIELRMHNSGDRALWYRPGIYTAPPSSPESFGSWGRGGCRMGFRRTFTAARESAEERVLAALSELRRVPPGADFVLATVIVEPTGCALFRLRVDAGDAGPMVNGIFQGVGIPSLPAPLGKLPSVIIPALESRESASVQATLLPTGPDGRPALKVKATRDLTAPRQGGRDIFWWAATDGAGRYLDSGPMRDPMPCVEEFKVGEEETVEMPCDPPAGTRRLWLGFEGDGDEAVPPPLELPGPTTH
jgi:hypothetical protein